MRIEKYLYPTSAEEAVRMLEDYQGEAMIMAGGTDLVLWIKEGKREPSALVDIDGIEELHGVLIREDEIILGAGVTHAEVAENRELKKRVKCLTDGCRSVGSPQIRNIATVGGNIVSAQPAADSTVNFVALGAECEIASAEGRRRVPVEQLFLGVGKSALNPGRELLTKIYIPLPSGPYATSFQRLAPRNSLALPIVNVAAYLAEEDGRIAEARIVASPVAVTPFRLRQAEQYLTGKQVSEKGLAAAAGQLAHDEANPRDSLLRGSGEYRKVLVQDLVTKAVEEILGKLLRGGAEHAGNNV